MPPITEKTEARALLNFELRIQPQSGHQPWRAVLIHLVEGRLGRRFEFCSPLELARHLTNLAQEG
jgi:hypothetical protein